MRRMILIASILVLLAPTASLAIPQSCLNAVRTGSGWMECFQEAVAWMFQLHGDDDMWEAP